MAAAAIPAPRPVLDDAEPVVPIFAVWEPATLLLAHMIFDDTIARAAGDRLSAAHFQTEYAGEFFELLVARARAGRPLGGELTRELRESGSPFLRIAERAAEVPWSVLQRVHPRTLLARIRDPGGPQ